MRVLTLCQHAKDVDLVALAHDGVDVVDLGELVRLIAGRFVVEFWFDE